MHEYSLAKDLANIIFKELKKRKAEKVHKITFILGRASNVDKEFLEHSFKEHIFKGTICENAELEFILEEPKIKCKICGKEYEMCVEKCSCGNYDFDIVAGNEVYVREIEIE